MNTAIAQKLQQSEVVVRDRTRVLGYSGGAPGMVMDAKKSNLDCNPIVGGRLLLFAPGKDGYLGGLDARGRFKQAYVDIMPSDYANLVDKKFHVAEDFGFRVLPMLTKLPYRSWVENGVPRYEDEAEKYFNVLHTSQTCPYGLNQKVQMQDPEVGVGELVYQHCPTCQIASLTSEETNKRIYDASQTLDSGILIQLRDTLLEANRAALRHAEAKSAMVMGDIANTVAGKHGFRTSLNTVDRIHLKMMHKEENAQTNTQNEMFRTLASELASALKGAQEAPQSVPTAEAPVQTSAVLTEEEIAEYLELKAKQKAAQERMAKAREAKK